ncbi:MAG: HEAT repeat domain-containing protein [Nitrospirota bacterium]|nr:HEAT repeat domain-containing protein [Nitrospirota bacterium]
MHNPEKKRQERKKVEQIKDFILENFERAKEEREEIIHTSVEVLKTGDEDARWMAVGVLAETGDKRIIQPLITALSSDPSPRVRAEAAGMLGDWRDMAGPFDSLIIAIEDPSELVGNMAFEALEGITVLEKETGKYESADREYIVHVAKPDSETETGFTFFIKKTKKMQRLRQKAFVLLCPGGSIKGKTDAMGRTVFSNEELRTAGYRDGVGNIRFVLR